MRHRPVPHVWAAIVRRARLSRAEIHRGRRTCKSLRGAAYTVLLTLPTILRSALTPFRLAPTL